VTLRELIDSASIAAVWCALGGAELRHGRAPAFWRNGDGHNVSIDAEKNVYYDFVTGDGGGILDLIQTARGCDRKEAIVWLAGLRGVALDNTELSPEKRKAWARNHARDERDLPKARWFGRTARMLATEVLEQLPATDQQRQGLTQLLMTLKTDFGTLAEYRAWGPRKKYVQEMVRAVRERDAQAQQQLAAVLMEGITSAEAA